MTRATICYHTRERGGSGKKLSGGTFGGRIDQETVNQLVEIRQFTVLIKPSGTPVFFDKQGREVSLYIWVDPSDTRLGKSAIEAWRKTREAENQQKADTEKQARDRIEELMGTMSPEQIIKALETYE